MDDLHAAFGHCRDEIRAIGDPDVAYWAAVKLAAEVARFRGEAADLRSQMAARIREAGGLSLRELGERIGRGKPTVQVLLRRSGQAR